MKRYQVYLNPQSVEVLDVLTEGTDINRSEIIRASVDSVAENISKALAQKRQIPGSLDSLIGIISTKGEKKTNIAENIDEIYEHD